MNAVPVWILLCWMSVFDWLKALSHTSHWYGFSFVCTLKGKTIKIYFFFFNFSFAIQILIIQNISNVVKPTSCAYYNIRRDKTPSDNIDICICIRRCVFFCAWRACSDVYSTCCNRSIGVAFVDVHCHWSRFHFACSERVSPSLVLVFSHDSHSPIVNWMHFVLR